MLLETARLAKATKAIQLVERSASLQPLSPKAARPLTPGQTAEFRLGPVDSPTLFHGDFSYQLEVPDDATRVTFTLESDADLELLVRYGKDPELQDGRPVYDYAADEVFAGTEEILITPRSDPPLRAGTYFVGVIVFATGVVVNCTLTAEVEREGGTPPPTSGRTLTPSQPVTFQRGPVDNPTIFFGPNSFQLEVPEDASRVTFTLESDADVALRVRYGEDNAIQDGRLVTDHAANAVRGAGIEKIVITPSSDPPLRAGTYFVSVSVFATGVVANCTLTAEVEREGEAPPTISGGTFTPGQPADFRLGPVDSPILFNRDHSFRLEAPEAASRITFTLESVDPDVDVDLYVRFGEDNMIQNGRPVFDHRSQKLTGNERIGITRRSDPPLRAGTYFVSILVFDTGVVAEGTLTATVETDAADCHLDVTCHPEWSRSATGVALMAIESSEGSFALGCSGTLLNNSRQDRTPYFLTAAHCVQTEEEARSVTALWSYQTRTCNGDLPDLRSVPRTEGAGLISTLGGAAHPEGDVTLLQLEGDLPDGIVFQGWDAAPQPVGAQVTGIHHPGSDDWGRFKRISFGQIIPESVFGTSDDTYFNVSWPVGQGYTEPGSSGSAVFSNSETVVGALSGGDIVGYACPTEPVVDVFTHFSVFYPHIRSFIDSTLPEITGGPIPPGQPAGFRLGPVDAPMLFSGDSSFQVEVPEGAARVTFTLESVNPDVNVDLHVRYGEDNAIQGGSVVADYSSTGPTGNEQIVVTRQSDPPLRAGTYFVSLMLRTTGAVAEVTVTAEFDTPAPAGGQNYYFPHLAVGASWQTTITYINHSAEEVTCQTDFLSDHGTPLMVSFAGLGMVVSRTDVLPPGGSVHQETNVDLSAPLAPGWARATCSGPVKASLLFRQRNSEGVPTAEAGVNAAAVPATRFVTFAEQGEGQFGTGVAYANPSATSALVTFTARDAVGQMLASVDRELLPGGHDAHGMGSLFGLTSFTGSVEVTSTVPIVSLSLNFEADPVFSSLPPGEIVDPTAGAGASFDLDPDNAFPSGIAFANGRFHVVDLRGSLFGSGKVYAYTASGRRDAAADFDLDAGNRSPFGIAFANGRFHVVDVSTGKVYAYTASGRRDAAADFDLDAGNRSPSGIAFANGRFHVADVSTGKVYAYTASGRRDAAADFDLAAGNRSPSGIAFANGRFHVADVSTGKVYAYQASGRRDAAADFDLHPAIRSPKGTTFANGRFYVVDFISGRVYAHQAFGPATEAPDLVVQTPSVSDSSPNAGESFAFTTTVRNQGSSASTPTTLRYYRSADAVISTGDTEVGTGAVSSLSASGASNESISLTAPSAAGTYYYGACVDPVSGESRTGNNCSGAVSVTVMAGSGPGAPDLVIQTPSVSDSSPNAGESFTLSATVRNQGNGQSASTTLRYYRSTDATISAGDTEVGTDAVNGLSASGASDESISLTAPSTAGTYYYGACVDPVSGESATGNNCSGAVSVTVMAGSGPGGLPAGGSFDLDSDNRSPQGITFANGRFHVVDWLDEKVYAYTASGQRDAAADFDLDSDSGWSRGITFANGRFHVVDSSNEKVYAYTASGQRDAAADFDLDSDNSWPRGITFRQRQVPCGGSVGRQGLCVHGLRPARRRCRLRSGFRQSFAARDHIRQRQVSCGGLVGREGLCVHGLRPARRRCRLRSGFRQ